MPVFAKTILDIVHRTTNIIPFLVTFSAFGVLTVFGTGNATQVNTITTAINSSLLNFHVISQSSVGTTNLIIGIIVAILVALILLGGIKRIGQVAERLVPFMAFIYIFFALGVVVLNRSASCCFWFYH